MAVNSNGQFDYPARGWSTGRMRKRGQKPEGQMPQVAMDLTRRGEPQSALVEMEKAAGFGLAARGGPTGATTIPQSAASMGLGKAVEGHVAQIQDGVNQVAAGDMTPQGFKKLLKKLGWTGDHESGQFTDPSGQQHEITPQTGGQ